MFKQVIDVLITTGTWALVPIIGLCLYDKIVQEPKRPIDEDGEPAPAPHVFGFAWNLLPFAILAAMVRIGLPTVLGWWSALVTPLSYLALPLVLLSLYDIWMLAPQRPRTPSGRPGRAPWYIRFAKLLAVVALLAVVFRIGVNEVFDWVKQVAEAAQLVRAAGGPWCAIDSWFLSPAPADRRGHRRCARARRSCAPRTSCCRCWSSR